MVLTQALGQLLPVGYAGAPASDLGYLVPEEPADGPHAGVWHVDIGSVDLVLHRPEHPDLLGKVRVHEPADGLADLVEGAGLPAAESPLQVLEEELARDQQPVVLAVPLEPLEPGVDIVLQVADRVVLAALLLFLNGFDHQRQQLYNGRRCVSNIEQPDGRR